MLDDVQTTTAFVQDLRAYLRTSDHAESRAFIRPFVREVAVRRIPARVRRKGEGRSQLQRLDADVAEGYGRTVVLQPDIAARQPLP